MGQEIKLLQYASLLIVAVLFVLLGYLVTRKRKENKRNEQVEKEKQILQQDIYLFIQNENHPMPVSPLSKTQTIAMEDLLTRFIEIMEGEKERSALRKLAYVYLKDFYTKNLHSRKWSIRMNTLYNMEKFHMVELKNELLLLIQKKNKQTKDEKVQIYRILATFQYDDLFSLINQPQMLGEKDYRSILTRMESNSFVRIVLLFEDCIEELQLAMLDVLGIKKDLDYIPFLEDVFQKHEGEIRLRALKALTSIGIVRNMENYIPLYQSEVWQERMMIARLLGFYKEESNLWILRELLHDSIWWVRSQSAESITKYKNGKELFELVIQTSDDAFARDMALEWMNKGDK